MENKSTVFVKNTSQGQLLITCLIAVLFLPNYISAQQRNADSIFTVRKDTLVVRITEVSINDVKYRKIKDDSSTIHILPKTEVSLIVYGNGEREESRVPNIAPDTAIALPKQRYHKRLLVFQQQIAHWQPSELVAKKQFFRSNSVVCTVFGTIAAIAGPALFISGYNKLWDNFWGGSSNQGAAQMTVGFLISGASVPLFIFGAKNGKRAKLIKIELERRAAIKY